MIYSKDTYVKRYAEKREEIIEIIHNMNLPEHQHKHFLKTMSEMCEYRWKYKLEKLLEEIDKIKNLV